MRLLRESLMVANHGLLLGAFLAHLPGATVLAHTQALVEVRGAWCW